MPKFSETFVSTFATDKDVVMWDSGLPGFGLRARRNGKKTFVIQYRNRCGRSRRMTIGRYGTLTLDQARKEAIRLMALVVTSHDPAEERRVLRHAETVRQLWDTYMEDHCTGRCKPRTIDAHKWLYKRFIEPKLGSRRLPDLYTGDIRKLHSDLRETPYNANRVLGLLRAMLNCAERWEMIPRNSNPAALIKPYPERKRERFLDEDELKALMAAIDAAKAEDAEQGAGLTLYEAAAIRLLIFTGCRLSEILTLPWDSVDLKRARIVLKQHKTDKYGDKLLPLNGPALAVLENLPRVEGNPYVIVGRKKGKHLVELQRAWRRVRRVAGLPDLHLHDLRHSFASFAVGAGVPLAVIGALLGHRSVQTTARYAHLAYGPLKDATNIVGNLLAAHLNVSTSSDRPTETNLHAA
jgi:integrase